MSKSGRVKVFVSVIVVLVCIATRRRTACHDHVTNGEKTGLHHSKFRAVRKKDFSSVWRTVSDMRSRLNEDTIEAVELLRWGMRAGILNSVVS